MNLLYNGALVPLETVHDTFDRVIFALADGLCWRFIRLEFETWLERHIPARLPQNQTLDNAVCSLVRNLPLAG